MARPEISGEGDDEEAERRRACNTCCCCKLVSESKICDKRPEGTSSDICGRVAGDQSRVRI